MFNKFSTGMKIGFEGLKFMFKHPKTLLSVVVFWLTLGSIFGIVYLLLFVVEGANGSIGDTSLFLAIFLIVTAYSFSVSVASLVLLELVEQHENTNTMSIKKALSDMVKRDLLRSLPLIIIWSGIMLFVRTIQMITMLFTYAIIATFRLDFNPAGKVQSSFFQIVSKGFRVFIYFALPAIAWEELGTFRAIRKSWKVIRKTWLEIIGSIVFANMITGMIIIPLFVVFTLQTNTPEASQLPVIIATAITLVLFSLSSLILQLYCGEIYLWYMRWEQANQLATQTDGVMIDFDDFDKPSLLRDSPVFDTE